MSRLQSALRCLERAPASWVPHPSAGGLLLSAVLLSLARAAPELLPWQCGRGDKRTPKGKRKAQSNGACGRLRELSVCGLRRGSSQPAFSTAGKCRPKSDNDRPKLPTERESPPPPAPPL